MGWSPQVPVYLRGHRESCQTSRSAPLCRPLPPTDPRTAAGQTLSGKPPAAPGLAPTLLCEQCEEDLLDQTPQVMKFSQSTVVHLQTNWDFINYGLVWSGPKPLLSFIGSSGEPHPIFPFELLSLSRMPPSHQSPLTKEPVHLWNVPNVFLSIAPVFCCPCCKPVRSMQLPSNSE